MLVNSAGCGAAMKDYGRLVGTPEAEAFAARVRDIHEWLAERVDELPALAGERASVIVQDPCHLRHVQKAHEHVRTVLARYVDVVELDDEGLCCGAGGAYSALQPELASSIRDRKVAAVARACELSGATVVASANPGCAMHLAAAGLDDPPSRRHRRRSRWSRHVTRYQDLAERLRGIAEELDERLVRTAPRRRRERRDETPAGRQDADPSPPRHRQGRHPPRHPRDPPPTPKNPESI